MKNAFKDHMLLSGTKIWQFAITSVFVLAIAGCGEVDENDGLVVTEINLPMDSVLTLYCPDAGIAAEPCILDDPENPYAITPVLALEPLDPEEVPDEDDERPPIKWRLSEEAPSAKAKFYLWATAQAMQPMGVHQYHVGWMLQRLYTESGSDLAREQALKAYRSVLDNYFDDVWFWKYPDPPEPTEYTYPKKVRLLAVHNLWEPDDIHSVPLFDNDLAAWETLGEWGYTYESDTGEVSRNY